MKIYELALHVEEIQDGGETAEEVSSLGDPLPATIRPVSSLMTR